MLLKDISGAGIFVKKYNLLFLGKKNYNLLKKTKIMIDIL